MKIVVIGSGSKGNSTYIIGESAKILIDAGFSYKSTMCKLNSVGVDSLDVDALLLTHEHTDHISGLASIISKTNAKYYISEESFINFGHKEYLSVKDKEHCFIQPMSKIQFNDMIIEPFELSHDSKVCLGFIIEEYGKKIVYAADTGFLNQEYYEMLKGADCYLFEANHDPGMQMRSNRPFLLKKRILGDRGHLSNEDSAIALSYLINENTKNVIFVHRSHDCNSVEKLKETVFEVFDEYSVDTSDISFEYAEQDYPSRIIEV